MKSIAFWTFVFAVRTLAVIATFCTLWWVLFWHPRIFSMLLGATVLVATSWLLALDYVRNKGSKP